MNEFIETNKVYLSALIDTCGDFFCILQQDPFLLVPELHINCRNKDVALWLKDNFAGANLFYIRNDNVVKIENVEILKLLVSAVASSGKFKRGSAEAFAKLLTLQCQFGDERIVAVTIANAINEVYYKEHPCAS